ncbi:hypothetical protein GGR21_002536 [Dysgonomonas hofstadii]|uniref:Contractile injection system tube protein N-terminal domain-containing protein n=1 Tax=Dysgonomonas hofstadii TaxID=637886 RepID=A0A840CKW9_9BACT|nr:hypothetical protein [Dysgonomonas hofstadii]MBB4036630.1 hypothetical protein [Dysgonomonas hofstadii]
MNELAKMTIYAFEKQDFSGASKSEYILQVNPAVIKYKKEIALTSKGSLGGQFRAPKYAGHKPVEFSFDTILDATGALEPNKDIVKEMEKLEAVMYNMDGEIHRPYYLKVSWGSFIFKGTLNSLDSEYTLFTPTGSPLRVKLTFSFTGYMDKLQAAKIENRRSPDLSRLITLKADENIPQLCDRIYGDASYCTDIARCNHLVSFRNVKQGTSLMFPALVKKDEFTQ